MGSKSQKLIPTTCIRSVHYTPYWFLPDFLATFSNEGFIWLLFMFYYWHSADLLYLIQHIRNTSEINKLPVGFVRNSSAVFILWEPFRNKFLFYLPFDLSIDNRPHWSKLLTNFLNLQSTTHYIHLDPIDIEPKTFHKSFHNNEVHIAAVLLPVILIDIFWRLWLSKFEQFNKHFKRNN